VASHASESLLYGASFSTPEFLEIFNDHARVQAWFDVEVALAKAQGELNVIPKEAAIEISKKAYVENVDVAEIGRGISETAHPIVPAIRALEQICEGGAGEYIHYGATTQDIMDTGLVLQIKKNVAYYFKRLNSYPRCSHRFGKTTPLYPNGRANAWAASASINIWLQMRGLG
jgi:adenylosuccinate lyase